MNCPKCSHEVPIGQRNCPACETFIGFPNVRIASDPKEVGELELRWKSAEASAVARKCEKQLLAFTTKVENDSKAVISCSELELLQMMESGRLKISYHRQIESGQRQPEENFWDQNRDTVDTKLFPGFKDDIVFAALSLDGKGIRGYGSAMITLRSDLIEDRATVFHENSVVFADKRQLGLTKPIPPGYRATWMSRAKLAATKLIGYISAHMNEAEFPHVLIKESKEDKSSDFIEVHIFGRLAKVNLEKIVFEGVPDREQRMFRKQLGKLAQKEGILLG